MVTTGRTIPNSDVDKLVSLINGLTPDSSWARASQGSGHLGAILADAVLQAGVNYKTLVVRRVEAIKSREDCRNLSGLRRVLRTAGPEAVLGLANARKAATLWALTDLLLEEQVETAAQLAAWMAGADASAKLTALFGVGPKTIEFLKLLVGLEAVAIDVHVLRATKAAGVREKDPVKLAVLFATAAKICGRRLSEIDGAIWNERASKAEQ